MTTPEPLRDDVAGLFEHDAVPYRSTFRIVRVTLVRLTLRPHE